MIFSPKYYTKRRTSLKKILSILLMAIMVFGTANLNTFAEPIEGNLLSEADSTFESGTPTWKVFHAGEISVVDNPKGEGKVMKYKVDTEA